MIGFSWISMRFLIIFLWRISSTNLVAINGKAFSDSTSKAVFVKWLHLFGKSDFWKWFVVFWILEIFTNHIIFLHFDSFYQLFFMMTENIDLVHVNGLDWLLFFQKLVYLHLCHFQLIFQVRLQKLDFLQFFFLLVSWRNSIFIWCIYCWNFDLNCTFKFL